MIFINYINDNRVHPYVKVAILKTIGHQCFIPEAKERMWVRLPDFFQHYFPGNDPVSNNAPLYPPRYLATAIHLCHNKPKRGE